jgi:hypothetical protein
VSTTRSIGRLSEIAQVMVRHGFGYFLEAHKLSDLLPGRSAEERLASAAAEQGAASARGQHLRDVLDELGPTFVKFGQLLSTRPDVVPPDIIVELRGLQDDVRPFPFEQAERVIEEELGNTLERLFLDFEPQPVPGGAPRARADPRVRLRRHAPAGRRVRPLDPEGARLPPGGAQRAELPPPLRRGSARSRPQGLLAVHAAARPHARVDRRDPARRRRPADGDDRGAP